MTFDFARFAADFRVRTLRGRGESHHVRAGWIGARCPLCGKDHLGYSMSSGYFRCWACGFIRTTEVVASMARVSDDEARRIRDEYDTGRRVAGPEKMAPEARLRSCPSPLDMGPLGRAHRRYLRSRGFSRPRLLAAEWGLQGTRGCSGKWSWRVVAPIKAAEGRTLAWVGRTILPEGKPRYCVTEEEKCVIPPEEFLYGEHLARGDAVLVVEGPGDAWKIGAGAVATLSIDWHREQADKIRNYRRRYVMFDPESKAQKQARALAKWLSAFPGQTEVITGLASDPGALSEEDAAKIREELLS